MFRHPLRLAFALRLYNFAAPHRCLCAEVLWSVTVAQSTRRGGTTAGRPALHRRQRQRLQQALTLRARSMRA